jgi:HSP20 family protein
MSGTTSSVTAGHTVVAPSVDIFESEREIRIVADFPGVAPEALSVQLEGLELTLDGRRDGAPASHLRRSFRVPETIDADGVEAELVNGVLRVRLPKRTEALPRRIEVRAAD